MKRIWISSLNRDPQTIGPLLALAKRYGLDANGHFFTDDLGKLAWLPPLEQLADPSVRLWVIVGSPDPVPASVGFGLTLMALRLAGQRPLPALIWLDPTAALTADRLPAPLANAAIVSPSDANLGARMVAAAGRAAPPQPALPYRLRVHAHEGYGTWLEIGPAAEEWDGAMAGVCGEAKIVFQGVGPAGQLPRTALLEYPQQGLTLALADQEFSAWAVRNRIGAESSHFVKIEGAPRSLLFGPYSADDQAEVFVIRTALAP